MPWVGMVLRETDALRKGFVTMKVGFSPLTRTDLDPTLARQGWVVVSEKPTRAAVLHDVANFVKREADNTL